MKARASNLMIGSTTLAVITAAFIGFLGFRKIHSLQQHGPLRIIFEGSASGLHKGGSVNFDGVQVGEILSLTLDSIKMNTREQNPKPSTRRNETSVARLARVKD